MERSPLDLHFDLNLNLLLNFKLVLLNRLVLLAVMSIGTMDSICIIYYVHLFQNGITGIINELAHMLNEKLYPSMDHTSSVSIALNQVYLI